ncbi:MULTISPECIES: sensor histidine kinase [unclassified Undibacterium]|uniref:sensor histidine kinase n=1 Tax=unclassified Undibacterium TaxID=2630295 RepID=UPI002AC9899D|nr:MULTISPECIES: ATP-binding protein [unclassified Undibacterium]MEB0137889.1 histidine kinase dimerization/phospho-acceptor domain-containing protein [Undibacterium sp. CCC2.1]MEB0172009.1 histidine kinase dimerization/phospho-acceptor domain-containing protein [Undibacterium sp. CCC1.1]MEB0174897.1 histidine kinase dimerization/phospho-acceptor domain-containing protein [Undibacterium sp. CCC3.4]MEB0214895.1 histidine kinase dimerization/phospho-acceptor domain-containing protein [Undibacteri
MSALLAEFLRPTPSFWRSLQTLNISRIIVALCLLFLLNLRSGREVWAFAHMAARDICFFYLFSSIGYTVLKLLHTRHFIIQLFSQIALDIIVIASLYLASGGAKGGLSILFLFPLAGVAILSPLVWAFFFCSLVSLLLLIVALYQSFEFDDGNLLSQAGLFGASYFAVIYVVNRLASNLIRQEQLADQRGAELAVQQEINRVVIADMGDGILVLDQGGAMFEINPAAERMLGGNLHQQMVGVKLLDVPALRPMVDALTDLKTAGMAGAAGRISFVSISCSPDEAKASLRSGLTLPGTAGRPEHVQFVTHLKLRFIGVAELGKRVDVGTGHIIIFMQDVSDIENQAQQLKLASMGRLTASIAHEVRNPLSSISYAAALLGEDIAQLPTPQLQAMRLLKIIDDNVARLNQLIEDILRLSRKARNDVAPYWLMQVVRECVDDFIETKQVSVALVQIGSAADFQVNFDPGHLFEIVANLLSNALRYASGKPGSICLYATVNASGRQELHIQDDGPTISYDVRAHLFEPFYTTSRMGTGLGLYMARELCLNNQALLDYEYRVDSDKLEPSGRFVITFSGMNA